VEPSATTRTPGKIAQLREAGAEPVVVDGLDREAVIAAVRAAAPEVIVHQMTALAGMRSLRKVDQEFAAHQRTPDPGHRQPAGGRGAGGHPPGPRAKQRGHVRAFRRPERTVDSHVRSILNKLGFNSRSPDRRLDGIVKSVARRRAKALGGLGPAAELRGAGRRHDPRRYSLARGLPWPSIPSCPYRSTSS
jgi:hypothetical protein